LIEQRKPARLQIAGAKCAGSAAAQHGVSFTSPYTCPHKYLQKLTRRGAMFIGDNIASSQVMIAFTCLGLLVVGGMLIVMRLRHKYHPNLIGALIGGMLCFLLLEFLPSLT
jgi:hypothetical protein